MLCADGDCLLGRTDLRVDQRRVARTRRDRVDPDAAVLELHRPGPAIGALGGCVGDTTGKAAQGGDRAGQDDGCAVVQERQRQRLLHRKQHVPGVDVEIVVEALDGDIGELHAVDGAEVGNYHVEPAAIGSDLGVEAIKVLEPADVALHAGDVPADRGDRLVQFVLAAGEDIDERPVGDEPLCRCHSNPAGAAGNHGDRVL
jgi:hypothetical protein